MAPDAGEKFETLLLIQIASQVFKLVLIFRPYGSRWGLYEIFRFWFVTMFLKIPNSPLCTMDKSKPPLSIKPAIVEPNIVTFGTRGLVVQHIWGTCGLVMFNVILWLFGTLALFPKIRFPNNTTSSTNHSKNLSNFSWSIFSMVLRILRLEFLKFWVSDFGGFIFQKIQIHQCSLWRNQKPQLSRKWMIVERNGVNVGFADSSSTFTEYHWPCTIQGHFGVIRCNCDFL